jgi:hypothetical protein
MQAKTLPLTERHLALVAKAPGTKECSKCGVELPATLEFFGPVASVKSRLSARCRDCLRAYQRELDYYSGRNRRRRLVRARTISTKRIPKRDLDIGRALYPETDHGKPRTRAECVDAPRPCPYVSCKHNLYLDVTPETGSIKLNFPDLEAWEMGESCALDVAARGSLRLEHVGAYMNLTRERVRQLEEAAMQRLAEAAEHLGEFHE